MSKYKELTYSQQGQKLRSKDPYFMICFCKIITLRDARGSALLSTDVQSFVPLGGPFLDLLNMPSHLLFAILLIPQYKLYKGFLTRNHDNSMLCYSFPLLCAQSRSVWMKTFLTAFLISANTGNPNKCTENLLSLWQPHQTSCQPHQIKIPHSPI